MFVRFVWVVVGSSWAVAATDRRGAAARGRPRLPRSSLPRRHARNTGSEGDVETGRMRCEVPPNQLHGLRQPVLVGSDTRKVHDLVAAYGYLILIFSVVCFKNHFPTLSVELPAAGQSGSEENLEIGDDDITPSERQRPRPW
jgi:hypothetical protein